MITVISTVDGVVDQNDGLIHRSLDVYKFIDDIVIRHIHYPRLATTLKRRHGRIDVLVNNIGISYSSTSDTEEKSITEVNRGSNNIYDS